MMSGISSPVFIVGLHRSGSTLWHNLISMIPGMCRLTDMRFLSYRWQKDVQYYIESSVGDLTINENVDRMVEDMFSRKMPPPTGLEAAFWRFENFDFVGEPAFQKGVARRIRESDRSLGAVFRAFVEEITRANDCERPCVKFPVDVGHIPVLLDWYPNCRIIHITRDPRAMAMSRRSDPGGTAVKVARHPRLGIFIRRAVLAMLVYQYRWSSQLHQKYRFQENYQLFQYEDLLADPEKTLRRLCTFIDAAFLPEMLEPERGLHQHQPSSLTGRQQKGFDKGAATRWMEVINPLDRWLISTLTRRSMERFQYIPECHVLFAGRPKEGSFL